MRRMYLQRKTTEGGKGKRVKLQFARMFWSATEGTHSAGILLLGNLSDRNRKGKKGRAKGHAHHGT